MSASPEAAHRRDGEPVSARMHNYLGGGTNCDEADRRAAIAAAGICPQLRQMTAASSLFSARIARYAARAGIGQFLELGAGLPVSYVHDAARSQDPAARVCYVDSDPSVTDELDVLLDGPGRDGLAVVTADLRDARGLLADPDLAAVIDAGEPVCLLACWVLHLIPAAHARRAMALYAGLLAPGSILAVSLPVFADELMRARMERVRPAAGYGMTGRQFAGFGRGLEPVPPGAGPAQWLQPGWQQMPDRDPGPAYVLAGAWRKPG